MSQSHSDFTVVTGVQRITRLMQRLLHFPQTTQSYDSKVVYRCRTCDVKGAQGLCYLCSKKYHRDHDLVYINTNFTCNCKNTRCKVTGNAGVPNSNTYSNRATNIVKKFKTRALNLTECTFTNNENNFLLQSEYQCRTCKLDGRLGMCYKCATQCHQGHKIYYVRYGSFSCDCGARGETFCKALVKPTTSTAKEKATKVEKKDISMYSAFECPVCMCYMCAPIHMCERGHTVCGICITKIAECPLCRGKFAMGRNLSVEALSQALKIPCEDCEEEFAIADMNTHKKICHMKDYNCPLDATCTWTGKFWAIYGHCKEHHSDQVLNGSSHVFVLIDCTMDEDQHGKIINVEGILFLFYRKYDKEKQIFQAVVKYLNQHQEDCAFSYSLQFTSPNREESVVLKKLVRPRFEVIEDIYKLNNCVSLPLFRISSLLLMNLLVYRLVLKKIYKT